MGKLRRMPIGRPSDYSFETAADICSRLAAGEALSKICRDERMPALSTIYVWMSKHPEFAEMYARAREDQADTLADEILEIADDGRNDTYEDEDGRRITDWEIVNRSKLRVDARKWIAAKLKPKKYGDKVSAEHSGAVQFSLNAPWMLPAVGERNE